MKLMLNGVKGDSSQRKQVSFSFFKYADKHGQQRDALIIWGLIDLSYYYKNVTGYQ